MLYNTDMLIENDYRLLAQILDLAARRGLFGAQEMIIIGQLHQKLLAQLPKTDTPVGDMPEASNKD